MALPSFLLVHLFCSNVPLLLPSKFFIVVFLFFTFRISDCLLFLNSYLFGLISFYLHDILNKIPLFICVFIYLLDHIKVSLNFFPGNYYICVSSRTVSVNVCTRFFYFFVSLVILLLVVVVSKKMGIGNLKKKPSIPVSSDFLCPSL